MTLMRIRLELARTPEFPEGSGRHGYEFVAPLDKDGRIDIEGWRRHQEECTVRRFWADEPEAHGLLRHTRAGWRFDYDKSDTEDDEPFFKLDKHRLETGAYVSVTERDGVQQPFRVVSVRPLLTE